MTAYKKKDTKIFLILTVTAYVLLAGFMIYRAQQSPSTCPFVSSGKSPSTVVPVTKTTQTVKIKLPTLLELGSKSCAPCKMMEPILAKLKKEYAGIIKISFVDVWLKENVAVGEKHKVSSIPTQIIFDAKGKELWRHTGYISEEDILKQWKALGYDLPALKKSKK